MVRHSTLAALKSDERPSADSLLVKVSHQHDGAQRAGRPRRSRAEARSFPLVTFDASVVVYLLRAESELKRELRAE